MYSKHNNDNDNDNEHFLILRCFGLRRSSRDELARFFSFFSHHPFFLRRYSRDARHITFLLCNNNNKEDEETPCVYCTVALFCCSTGPRSLHSYTMPTGAAGVPGKKKKKGKIPAHQNTFAFTHNIKSKKTDQILLNPNCHVCRRCHDKIEWRKQYRKYKPRTALGKCNLCSQKRVKAAYHTICEACTVESTKAVSLLKEWNQKLNLQEGGGESKGGEEESAAPEQQPHKEEVDADHDEYYRVCAVCVKEPSIYSDDDDEEEDPAAGRRMKLRDRKTLERQKLKATKKPRRKDVQEEQPDDQAQGSHGAEKVDNVLDALEEGEDEQDPFLQAVGGADKLLTGEAYQNMLLERAQAEAS